MYTGKMKIKLYSVLGTALAILCVGLLQPVTASAQVTIVHVVVTESPGTISPTNNVSVTYCDQLFAGPCNVKVWPIPAAGITLAPGETLVLTQTGTFTNTSDPVNCPNGCTLPNFDTSDRANPGNPDGLACSVVNPCSVTIKVDTGAGLNTVYGPSSAGIPLNDLNQDVPGGNVPEGRDYTAPASVTQLGYTLTTGYADNVHGVTKFPTPFTTATHFLGTGLGPEGSCASNCYDAGVILITGQAINLITVTQGGWGAPPHGNNPGQFLVDHFAAINPVVIGGGCVGAKTLTFNSAQSIQNFLPQGGTPGTLNASAVNPTTSSAGVFAGQVLALQLNVSFSNLGLLGSGLGGFVVTPPGATVNQILADANKALGGCGLPSYVTSISQLNDIVDSINEMFD